MQDDEPPDDDLHIEDLAEPLPPHMARLLAVVRRLAWRPRRRGMRSPRVGIVAMTLLPALALVLLVSDNQPPPGAQFALGAAPITIQPGGATVPITMASHTPTQMGSSGWEQIALPAPPDAIVDWYTPSPADPATVYACTSGRHSGELVVWRSRDASAHWTSLPLPPLMGNWCEVQVAADAPARVSLLIGTVTDYPPCDGNPRYLSDDGGDHWMQISGPTFGPTDAFASECTFWATAHHLFFLYSYEQGSRTNPIGRGPQLSILARSDDDGRTWVRADRDLGSNALFRPFQLSDENTWVASVIRMGALSPQSKGAELWETRDGGASWHHINTMAQGWTANLVTRPLAPAVSPASVYAMLEEQIPSDLFRLKARRLSDDGSTWRALPPLPVDGATPTRMGLTTIVGETADGRLLGLGVDPVTGVPAEGIAGGGVAALRAAMASQWLWAWDPRTSRWQAIAAVPPIPPPLSADEHCSALCWQWSVTDVPEQAGQSGGSYLWLRSWDTDAPIAYRIFVPNPPPGGLLS